MNVLVILLACVAAFAATGRATPLPDVTSRVEQTLAGLFFHYWRHDPHRAQVGYFFDCSQVGSLGDWSHCTCESNQLCTSCYRWWDAVALEAIANHGIYTNTKANASVADIFWAHSPYNQKWNGTASCTYVDDFAWYSMAYLRVYEWLKGPKWLTRAVAVYNWTWQYGWDGDCGGFWWMSCGADQFKDSITNVQVLHLAAKLSYMLPKVPRYLNDAQKIWDWFFSFDNGYGLMSDEYLVSTGGIPQLCCNNSITDLHKKCSNSRVSGTSYNQGLLMSAAAFLYKRTGNNTYLDVGLRALEAIFQNYTTKEGILVDEPRGSQTYLPSYGCVANSDPGGDWYSFNGIFMNHLSYFTALLADGSTLSNQTVERIKNLVQLSSNAAWNRSAVWPPFPSDDKCNAGPLKPAVKYPKFHWWWGQNVVAHPVVPPDPRPYFHKTQLRCHTAGGNNTQLWQGMVSDEDTCVQKCATNHDCSKYLYQTYEDAVPNLNCWIWSYNRTNHICDLGDTEFNVGVERPVGNVTCAGHCNSEDPLVMEYGVCYCDSNCTQHLDCCLDYADHCTTRAPITCKGQCDSPVPHPVLGGGYCWCMHGCNPWETDNNSDGTCCPDYSQLCQGTVMPMCLDARTQGSALNLFLAHLKLTQLK